ncbi:glycine zipper 2TM domain-containing protein [Paraglaciecola sp. MB-3u-78]|uniref:glycine zipper 2TM domain-containing protein n=1 Tax=Paraglaciecola sp. MB-3u-78 TaxID=2058332 RepID=UPI000C34EAB5|nr:glycine zipper 2TM domain-containing protein [Paraglaciecola sp. MB-3u-78]PKG97139.1 hypothetical protein CXF95_21295 [Paraglaciecola sp. MB-3u-78]
MKLLITSALLFLAFPTLVQAKHDPSYQNNHQHSRGAFKAKVINATPVYKYLTVRQPQAYCEPAVIHSTHRHSHDNRSHNKSAAIIGGVLGGVIGHAASDNNHKGLGTIVGAVIGSSLGHNIGYANNNHTRNVQIKQQNCVVTSSKTKKIRVLDGYRVTYRSQGKIYRNFRQDKPQKYMRIDY